MHNITVQELKQRKDANETLYILDVREPSEYAEVNMGAKLIPLGQVMSGQIDDIEDWKDKEVIVHCRSGVRSLNACMMLEQLGFINTKNLEGGIIAWVALNQ
ncbi:MAG: rhodanese-like domain-containing protein [Bacteroidetes bacterium]|jgi:rhodanese-related sulfurtransferase|nr:rhodanese-like domain-containing protein [Bacteroidota bacterium]HQW46565.1 rhodanese-like domain-containing protein [Chitinophagaceae bacterium]